MSIPKRCLSAAAASVLLTIGFGSAGCGKTSRTTTTPPPPPPPTCPSVCSPSKLTRLDLLAGQPGGAGWVDGTLAAAHFADPWTFAGDGQGHLYVVDGNAIRAIDMVAGSVTTLAGAVNEVGGADGPGPQARFNQPSGLAYRGGEIYLTDTENHTIRKIDLSSGLVSTIAGHSPPGTVDGIGTAAAFDEPEGLVVDANGNLFIADTDNDTIREMNLASGQVTTVAGTAGSIGMADGVGAAALFSKPKAMAFDGSGQLYVCDSANQSIRKIAPSTFTVSTVTTFGTAGDGPIPQGIAIDGSNLLVSLFGDGALVDDRIVQVAGDGSVTDMAGAQAKGFVDGVGSAARFYIPAGLWNGGAGVLYVADNGNAAVRAIALATATVSTYAGRLSVGSADGTGTAARFSNPQGLAVGADAAYVADTGNATIRKVTLTDGQVTTIAGVAGQIGSADGASSAARFDKPMGLALDEGGQQLYVADTQNGRIRQIDLRTGTVSTLTPATAPGDTFGGFDSPIGVAFEGGRLFVTDYTAQVVVAIDLAQAQASTVAGTYGVPGRADGVGTAAAFYGPLGIAGDGLGHLYVAEDLNQTVRKIAISTGDASTSAASTFTVSTVAGQPTVAGSGDGFGKAASFDDPFGLTANTLGDLFVSDSANNTVRHIDLASGEVTTPVGTPKAKGVSLGPLPAQLSSPTAIALTQAGGVLILSENAVLIAH
jgi:sugar lactone lactonase YvrE